MKTHLLLKGLLILGFGAVMTTAAQAATYMVDPTHSTVGFSVKHLTVSEVQGNFSEVAGTIAFDPAKMDANAAEVTIQAKSINTGNEKRDGHLRTGDFFDTEKFPTITFKSTSATVSGTTLSLSGDLTIKGVTKNVTIALEVSGPIKNPMGGDQVIGASGQLKINRQDYGVSWNKQMDQGGYVVGDDVLITINIEAHQAAVM
jgi:polyisoprenoid-binding protein YceI